MRFEWPPGSGRSADYSVDEYLFLGGFIDQCKRGEITREEMVNQITTLHDLKVEFGIDITQPLDDPRSRNGDEPTIKLDQNIIGGFRSTDPPTSKLAAVYVWPRTGNQRHRLLVPLLHEHPKGLDTHQLSALTAIPWQTASTRLSELQHKAKLVDKIGERKGKLGAINSIWAANARAMREARERGEI